ncbi:unnamed protein product [Danaus chrysippus]|uniref:(African queen) hypothetical protein n=1 Tax=Danaus chrysippus TaxID=151541 RepID=A0A8J2R7S7_9NEOP|nr:unnamed protein product [Danaus chrysippus]
MPVERKCLSKNRSGSGISNTSHAGRPSEPVPWTSEQFVLRYSGHRYYCLARLVFFTSRRGEGAAGRPPGGGDCHALQGQGPRRTRILAESGVQSASLGYGPKMVVWEMILEY